VNDKYFLPHFYIPKNIVVSKRSTDELPRIFLEDNYDTSTAVFFSKQNGDEKMPSDTLNYQGHNNPLVEFKEINPTKYRIRIHQASRAFPLVFSESFHEEWKIYLNKIQFANWQTKSKIPN